MTVNANRMRQDRRKSRTMADVSVPIADGSPASPLAAHPLDILGRCEASGRDLPTDRGWCLLPPSVVGPEGPVDVVVAGDTRLQPVIFMEVAAQPLAKQLFPAVPILWHRRIDVIFFE